MTGMSAARPSLGAFEPIEPRHALRALPAIVVAVALALTTGACAPASPASPAGTPPGYSASAAPAASADLDRLLADDEAQRERRNRLVDTYVVPLVDDERVIAALRAVPRHSFVPLGEVERAYGDHPLPIGYGQTISQPSLVAMMTELLEIAPGERVLEIGTGSGYQAAILRELTDAVYTVEIVPELAATAREVLDALGYGDVATDRRDGYFGWPEHAPYDAIVVTAAPDHLPSPLVDQLTEVGRIVIPIGPPGDVQTLWLVTRDGDEVAMEQLGAVMFVPLTREP